MCGVAGAFDLAGRRDFPELALQAMLAAMDHRGPDDRWAHAEPGLAMGATRLAIVDPAGGRQPVANEDGSVWAVCNGELFDYPRLHAELRDRGHRLASRCDTELWPHLWEDFGPGVFERAKGQFAVALWDRRSRSLFLARDRVGICPLHWVEADGWLLWASEIKALLASGLVAAVPDPAGLDHFFAFSTMSSVRTAFAGVRSVSPGGFVRAAAGRVDERLYWDLDFPDAGTERRGDRAGLAGELETRLRLAVERRLRGDVPVASYISGGLDSTVVLGLAGACQGAPPPSFTIGLADGGPDERVPAAQSAALLGSPLTELPMGLADIARAYPELIVAAEGPVAETSCAAFMRLSEAVRRAGLKVVLTGEGADEALAGYPWFKNDGWRAVLRRRAPWALPALRALGRAAVGCGPLLPPADVMGAYPAQLELHGFQMQVRNTLYSPDFRAAMTGRDLLPDLGLVNQRLPRWAPLNQSLYFSYKVILPGLLTLAKGDRAGMRHSVELRYPFLDEDVIEFCAGLDPRVKLRGRTDKWLLREVARRVLPRPIASRPKTMLHTAWASTFLGPAAPAWAGQLLEPESLARSGWFDPAAVARRIRLQRRRPLGPRGFAFDLGLANVVTIQLWHHLFLGGGLCDLPTWQAPEFTATAPLGPPGAA
ncbi:MAG: asparagine synthase (glutamine-hydrolyzing) [Propionibacteriaceae bacterium]|jgi:asparagine synthase (glutamine-hydrolysing)|nr:asparagine synthase (glutamine-hydrolyzing) [Propionibacteriaceae bacterium]